MGGEKPNWDDLVPHIKAELSGTHNIEVLNTTTVTIKFEVIMIVADMIEKPHLLKMFQHNGIYGCMYCTAAGITIDRVHCYYPFDQEHQIRTSEVNDRYVNVAEKLNKNAKYNVVGVKGRSAFSMLVKGLPLSAGIDYMHCILLGVYQDVLKLQIKSLSRSSKCLIKNCIDHLNAPIEMTAHAKKVAI